MAGPITIPTDVVNGNTLDYIKLNQTSGYFTVLYDAMNTYSGMYPPIYVQGTSNAVSLAHNVTSETGIQNLTYGIQYVYPGGYIDTQTAQDINYLTGRRLFIYFATQFSANTLGFRKQTISIEYQTGNTTPNTTFTATRTPPATGVTTINQLVMVPFTDTASPSSFQIHFYRWQNSGSTLASVTSYFKIYQIPTCFT